MVVSVAQLAPAISTVFLFCSHDGIIQYSSSLAAHVLCSSVPSLSGHVNNKRVARETRRDAHVFQSQQVIALEWPVHDPSFVKRGSCGA